MVGIIIENASAHLRIMLLSISAFG
jgi:hypothetical protein